MSRHYPPAGYRLDPDGAVACPHRDCSCCPECEAAHVEILDLLGRHFWISDPRERAELREALS